MFIRSENKWLGHGPAAAASIILQVLIGGIAEWRTWGHLERRKIRLKEQKMSRGEISFAQTFFRPSTHFNEKIEKLTSS